MTQWQTAAEHVMRFRQIFPRALQRMLGVSYPTAFRVAAFFQKWMRQKEIQEKATGTGLGAMPTIATEGLEAFFIVKDPIS